MIAVIFEVCPKQEGRETYLEIAASLLSELQQQPGFLSIERFESLMEPGKLLSLSFWEDDASVANWRAHPHHVEAQFAGRQSLFRDYRLRVAAVIRDYGMKERAQAPRDSAIRAVS